MFYLFSETARLVGRERKIMIEKRIDGDREKDRHRERGGEERRDTYRHGKQNDVFRFFYLRLMVREKNNKKLKH